MKLLNVEAVLNRDNGIQQARQRPEVMQELHDATTRYVILSHRWGTEEVDYEAMIGLTKMEEEEREEVRHRNGYRKIIESCKQAMKDGYKWLWIDTCCIDKRSSAELSEAINSMYRWYQNAQVCYVYLNDVNEPVFPTKKDDNQLCQSNGWPEWFERGWTLQELIAPKQVEFFNRNWVLIGNKRRFARVLEKVTGIPREVLKEGLAGKGLSVAQIMSWAADRKTTRAEDRAYSLMGLFGVNMPMLYGEGRKAFQRLQLEIIRVSSDHTIFAWRTSVPRTGSVLAADPSDFRDGGDIVKVEPSEFIDKLIDEYIEEIGLGYSKCRDVDSRARHQHKVAVLRDAKVSQQFCTFTVSNTGIQVHLPVVPSHHSLSHFTAILACSSQGNLVTVDLVSTGTSFDRTSTNFSLPATYPEFKTLHLTYHQDANEACCELVLDDKHASYYGFTRRGTYPRVFTGDTVTLSSLTDDLIVIVYSNDASGSRFAVGLGYYFGRGWVHVVCDDHPGARVERSDFAVRAYDRMWSARAEHSQRMPKQECNNERCRDHFVKHAHLPRSIWAARVVWGRWEVASFRVMVDVEQCPGCCKGPSAWTATSNDQGSPDTPGLMDSACNSYLLDLDGSEVQLDKCSGQGIKLGDYGDYSDGNFKCTGNIFEHTRILGADPIDSAYCPMVSPVSGFEWELDFGWNDVDLTAASPTTGYTYLALRRPKGVSLPANEHLVLLLKALSSRLSGKHLVITIIQCSDCYGVNRYGERTNSGDDSAPVSHSTEPEIFTPLCIVARPQVWRRELACGQRREYFKHIREHFYTLVDTYQAGTEACHEPTNKQKGTAIEFFSDLFGLKYLRNYVGEITFFQRLSWMMENTSLDYAFVGTAEEDAKLPAQPPELPFASSATTWNLFQDNPRSNGARDPRLDVVVPLLLRRCHVLHRDADEMQKMKHELKSISHTPSANLLTHIGNTFRLVSYSASKDQASRDYCSYADHDRRLDTLSEVQQIKELKVNFDDTDDDNERRTMEEDITGKILWLCWCGICAEVDELLPKVADCIQRDEYAMGLSEICFIITSTCIDPDDDLAHLQRIILDAGTGTSKHQLFLSTKATSDTGTRHDPKHF